MRCEWFFGALVKKIPSLEIATQIRSFISIEVFGFGVRFRVCYNKKARWKTWRSIVSSQASTSFVICTVPLQKFYVNQCGVNNPYPCLMSQDDFVNLKDILQQKKNIILEGADLVSRKGFTMVPNHVLESKKVSPGAKLVYAMLLKYAWQKDSCFPGQERLAKDMGVTDRSVRTYIQELTKCDFLSVKRRGQGKPNLYILKLTVKGSKNKGSTK